MILEELKIEGFRSLKSVTWRPGRLNVLIGPNGGGKSNLLAALGLLHKAATGELKKTIFAMGGMGQLVWDGRATRIAFDLLFRIADGAKHTYDLELTRRGMSSSYEITKELSHTGPGTQTQMRHFSQFSDGEAFLSQLPVSEEQPKFLTLSRHLRSWSSLQNIRTDRTSEIRAVSMSRYETTVEPDGQNLIAFLHTLYLGDRSFEDIIDRAMSAAFPNDYEKLIFPPEANGKVELKVRRKHRAHDDSSADLSDGTLRYLVLLAVLGNPEPAPLIAIDEPETGLHPRMMSLVAEVAANAAVKSQVILTTHSPELLDAFSDEVPTTTIVTSNGSETELKTVEGEELKRWIENYSFGKFAFSGEAEAVL